MRKSEKPKIIVLGGGLVGSAMAIDLVKDGEFAVTVADLSKERLSALRRFPISTMAGDLSLPRTIKKIIADHDLVIDALPGFLGFQTFRAAIEAGKNIVDIAFFPEDPFELDGLAKRKGVIAIMDCGVAPGLSNALVGYVNGRFDETDRVEIYVGGLPVIRTWPYEYRIVFSPLDVIEEYTRPARYVENGHLITRPALSDPELIPFAGVGTLEAFNTDGLRTLIKTIKAPNMKEKTLRYPGHIEKMAILRETGFFSKDPVEVAGVKVRPLDLTAKLLFPMWELQPGEEDLTVMRIIVEGKKKNKSLRYAYDLLDRFDPVTGTTSMARTTGYTATVVARLVAGGLCGKTGVAAPEDIGRMPMCMEFLKKGLAKRNIRLTETITEISNPAA
jgi:saccharopine dehydrogenase-like NADP-dependent oxidoreductase